MWQPIVDARDVAAELLSNVSDRAEILDFRYTAQDDYSENAWIEVSYRIPEFAFPIEDGLEFESPMMAVTLGNGWLCRACIYDWADEREGDLFLWFTQLIDGVETIRLPSGYEVVDPPSSEEVDETYAYFKGDSEMDGRDLVVEERAEVRRRQIPPEGYAGFKAAIDEFKDFGGKVYRIEKGGDR